MKKQRLIVAGIVLFTLGGLALYVSFNLFITLALSSLALYLLIMTEYEQYVKEQKILEEQKHGEELARQSELYAYRKRKYTKNWLENIW